MKKASEKMLHLYRYHSPAMAAINSRKDLQRPTPTEWNFIFKKPSGRILLSDNVVQKEVKLHAGLNIIVVLEDVNEPEGLQIAASRVNRVLETISFSTMAQCDAPQLLTQIAIRNDGASEGIFFEVPNPDNSIILGNLRIINESIFKEIWQACDANSSAERIARSLAWFRKAIGEQHDIDQFISLYIAVEVIKPLLRDTLKMKKRDPGEWDGVIEIFRDKIKTVDFNDVSLARQELFHGFKPLTPEFKSRIKSYLEPMRQAIIHGFGDILGLSSGTIDELCKYTKQRLALQSKTGVKGHFQNLPELDVLLKDFPEIIGSSKPKSFSMGADGKLDVNFSASHHFRLPANTVFKVNTAMLIRAEHTVKDSITIKFDLTP